MGNRNSNLLILLLLFLVASVGFAQYTGDLTSPGGTISASSEFSAATNGFDNDYGSGSSGTEWSSNNGTFPEWIRYDFGSGNEKTIKQYRFYTSYDPLYVPDDWQFQGSDNGSDWTTLHSVSNAGLSLSTWYTYNTAHFTNNTPYRYYQINVTGSETGNMFVDIEEIEMMEASATTPTVTTTAASSIGTSSATLGGNVTDDGGASVTERGVVYSSSDATPTIGEAGVTKDTNGSGTGSFSESIGSLSSGTTYYFQAYATNSEGTSYGGVENFTTLVDVTFTNGADGTLNFTQSSPSPPEDNWPLGQFTVAGNATGAALNSVEVTLAGTYSGLSGSNPFRLYAHSSNAFGSASAIGSDAAASGGVVTFSSLSDAIPNGTRYYWVTVDLGASAAGTINGTVSGSSKLNVSSGMVNGSSSYGQLNAGGEVSLPVFISSFSAQEKEGTVVISWTTESEVDNLGFILDRKTGQGEWVTIADYQTNDALKGQRNTSQKTDYVYIDINIECGTTYNYRLSDVNTSGEVTLLDVIQIAVGVIDDVHVQTDLEEPAPNPFNPVTKVTYYLAKKTPVTLTVVDLLGRHIRELENKSQPAGSYQLYWYGRDDSGQNMPSGIYFLVLKTGHVTKTKKMVLIQ